MDYSELLKDFIDDAAVHLDAFDGVLLSLERNGHDREMIMGALGALHTLKGNSGMMGFESLKGYIHLVEEVLEKIGAADIKLEDALDLLLDSANVLRRALRQLAEKPDAIPDLTDETLAVSRYFGGAQGRPENRQSTSRHIWVPGLIH